MHWPYNKFFVSAISIFVNDRVPGDSCKSDFKLLVRNGCVKCRKIKGFDACDMVEILGFLKDILIILLNSLGSTSD